MNDVIVKYTGTQAVIDFAPTGLSLETLPERLVEVLPLIIALIDADDAWRGLGYDEMTTRMRGRSAIEMMTQAATKNALEYATLLKLIILGEKSVADYGFPELSND